MSRNVCVRCGKPVYFAERKTSLGRDWHPTCLRCIECGRVLSPGQHAEHKGNPYCHTPCYKALFGPSLLGYGSNLASPANFAKKDNAAEFGHDYDDDVYKREIYSNSRTSALRRQKQRRSAPPSILNHDFSALPVPGSAADTASATASDFSSAGHSGRNLVMVISSANAVAADLGRRPSPPGAPVEYSAAPSVTSRGAAQPVVKSEPHTVLSAGAERLPDSGASSSALMNGPRSDSESAAKLGSSLVQVIRVQNSGSKFVGSDTVGKPASETSSGSGSTSPGSSAPVVNSVNSPSRSAFHPASGLAHLGSRLNITPSLRDILEKVESFNSHYEGKVHHQMTVEQLPNGEVKVQGPLRIYWGLSRPIQLRQCDDVPAPPIAKWRHSLCVNLNDGAAQNNNTPPQKLHTQGSPNVHSPSRAMRGMDDSILLSPASTDEVVMRRRNIRKFNTVAYRNDAPTRWKRASINGHIFNYDTSVFIPVLGSSTSVIADSTMTSPVVIETLLEKFKVENSPGEYVLSIVTEIGEQTQERLLGETERPLLERLQLGADDQNAKIFIKERRIEPDVTLPDTVKLPIMEEEEEEETLPAEVEQLMILPVAVLKGIMVKYEKDEEKEVRLLKAKYERCKRKIRQRLEEMRTA